MRQSKYTILIATLIVGLSTAANNLYFSKIGMEQGLSQLSVTSIYQDELGTMWFGTRQGVNRYYGSSISVLQQIFNDSNAVNGVQIKNICGNKNGLVYIQTQNGVNYFNLRNEKFGVISDYPVNAISYGIRHLWIAEENKLYEYTETKKLYIELPDKSAIISKVLQTVDQKIILGTISSGIYIIDQNKKMRQILNGCSQVSDIFEDSKKNIWVGTWQNGLYKIDRAGNIFNYLPDSQKPGVSSNFVRAICEDSNGSLWIGTNKGLDRLFVENEVFIHYDSQENNNRQLSNESIWALLKDSQGSIWVGTYFGGVNYFNPDIDFYTFHNLENGLFKGKPFPVISTIIENGKDLFLCTEGDGLIIYDLSTKAYSVFNKKNSKGGLTSDNIKTAYFDKEDGILWLGTHLGGLVKFDVKNKTFKSIEIIKGAKRQDIVRAIVPYGQDLLFSTYIGLYRINKRTNEVSLFSSELKNNIRFIVDFKIMGDYFWLAGVGLYQYNVKTGKIESFFNKNDDPNSLSHNVISKLLIDSKNRLWIGTEGGGVNLYDATKNTFVRFNSENAGLNNNFISNILESTYGYLILSTTQGLSILDFENRKTYNYSTENGFPLNSLYNGGLLALSNGEIFAAGMNGMVSFREENLSTPKNSFNLNFINIWINNELILPGDQSFILKSSVSYTNKIKLNHKQRMLTIEFASNNYIKENQPVYRYRLLGVSNAWTTLPSEMNKLNFINLKAGNYELELEGISPFDSKVIARTDLKIEVLPPIYLTWYAYLFYFCVIIFLIWRYMLFSRSKLMLKTSLEYEKKEKEHIERVNQSKLRFFTNISHEFRTPLTLIAGQIDMLLQSHNIQPGVYNRILQVKRNIFNMQNLINELLEFRKSEQGHLSIKFSQQDIVKFIYEIYLSFLEYANYRQIKFEFECHDDQILIWFDPIQMQKVFYNIFSNAFKYTPKDGDIWVNLMQIGGTVRIQVIDSGIGINDDDIGKIFDRFYQAENGIQTDNRMPGTGIGLALTKNILEAHFAEIEVERNEKAGSCFTITLKKGDAHIPDELKTEVVDVDKDCITKINDLDSEFMREIIEAQVTDNVPDFSMLIVEDHDELREMLKEVFSPIYKIFTAKDGEEGLELTLKFKPEIVLSDLMMPKMSGSEMCSKIKSNFQVCHIPVVLLTAQTAVEYTIEGFRLGADDYITKPFNIKTLVTRCNNLVNGRKLLQEKFGKQADFSPRLIATNNLDRIFLEKAQKIIEDNIDNVDFNLAYFAQELALGRTKLFNKIKGVTGMTPNDFIMNVKMKKAAQLLIHHPEYNISNISDMLGFYSPKYFTKCFKEHIGVTPKVYRSKEEGIIEKTSENDN
jgi:signal transduction histidine kinase/ligand-binding sensor domain-containing protein/DNA-binding response OmpR family regulator